MGNQPPRQLRCERLQVDRIGPRGAPEIRPRCEGFPNGVDWWTAWLEFEDLEKRGLGLQYMELWRC